MRDVRFPERVDTRVLQAIYEFAPSAFPAGGHLVEPAAMAGGRSRDNAARVTAPRRADDRRLGLAEKHGLVRFRVGDIPVAAQSAMPVKQVGFGRREQRFACGDWGCETGCSVAEEPMICMTLRWRETDSNSGYAGALSYNASSVLVRPML
jgi:hypothetical protein